MTTWLPCLTPRLSNDGVGLTRTVPIESVPLTPECKFITVFRKTMPEDCSGARLTVVLYDDVAVKVLVNGDVTIGLDEYACRIAIESVLQNEHVWELILASNAQFCPKFIEQAREENIKAKKVCVLMDVYTEPGEEWGPDMAQAIVHWGLPSKHLRQFSKVGSKKLLKVYEYKLIDKPKKVCLPSSYDGMKQQIGDWIEQCATPFLHPTKSRVGVKELSKLGMLLKTEIHDKVGDCHSFESLEKCRSLDRCAGIIGGLRKSRPEIFNAVIEAVTDANLAFGLTESLVSMQFGENRGLAIYSVSKTLSDFGSDARKASVPGAWLSMALGSFDSLDELDVYEFQIENHYLQPVFGFVHALRFLSVHAMIESEVIASRLKIAARIRETLNGDIADLGDRCEQIFRRRDLERVKGDTTRMLLALMDGGVRLLKTDIETDGDGRTLRINFEFPVTRVR